MESPEQHFSMIALRVLLEQRMDERDRRYEERFRAQEQAVAAALTAQKAMVDAAYVAQERAAHLQATEMARRLDVLNGEAGRLATVLAASVPREVWEEWVKSFNTWRAGVDQYMSQNRGKVEAVTEQKLQANVIRALIVTIIVTLVGLVLKFWK